MKKLFGTDHEKMKDYRKLKCYWGLMLKSVTHLNYQDYPYQRLFKKPMPETEIIDYLLSLDPTLKATCQLYQELLYSARTNDFSGFKHNLQSMKRGISPYENHSQNT